MSSGIKVILLGFAFIAFLLLANELGDRTKTQTLQAKQAYLDLREADLKKVFQLDGEWDFYWKKTPEEISSEVLPKKTIEMPSHWNSLTGEGFGYATYRLKLRLPASSEPFAIEALEQDTSFAVYANGKKLGGSGNPSSNQNSTIPEVRTAVVILPALAEQTVTLDLFVANYSHRKGGAWSSIRIGLFQKIQAEWTLRKLRETVIASVLGFITLFFGFILISKKSDFPVAGIFFFALAVLVRTVSTGERILADFFPLPYWAMLRLEYISWFWAVPALYYYFWGIFPRDFSKKIGYYFYGFSALLSLSLLLPSHIFTYNSSFYPFIFLANSCFLSVYLGKSFLKKRNHSETLLFGIVLLLIGAVNDTLHSMSILHTGYMAPPLVIFFVLLQIVAFAKSFQDLLSKEKKLREEYNRLGDSYSRFVPKEFLKFLGKKDITDIQLGEQVQRKMAILFADIRSFTDLSESLTPKENFDFLNSYLKRVGPIIRKHGGFIDKFIGDAIMALFPNESNQAIKASVEMQEVIRDYNEHRKKMGYQEIQVGIGVHTGFLILGTIGEHERMEGTVISDAVNLASRIEGLTKFFNSPVILSADTFMEASDDLGFEYRLLDRMPVKGKAENVFIVEVLDGYPPERKEELLKFKEEYILALDAYRRGEFEEAEARFSIISKAIPDDKVTERFVELSNAAILKKIDSALSISQSLEKWDETL